MVIVRTLEMMGTPSRFLARPHFVQSVRQHGVRTKFILVLGLKVIISLMNLSELLVWYNI